MAGLLTRESQSCPAVPHGTERNLQASHWAWNKLLLPQAPPVSDFSLPFLIQRSWQYWYETVCIVAQDCSPCFAGFEFLCLFSVQEQPVLWEEWLGWDRWSWDPILNYHKRFPTTFLALRHTTLKRQGQKSPCGPYRSATCQMPQPTVPSFFSAWFWNAGLGKSKTKESAVGYPAPDSFILMKIRHHLRRQ